MSDAEWRKENTTNVSVSYLKKSPEYRALKKAVSMDGPSISGWVKVAIREKLERDGWLSEGKLPKGKIVK